MACQEESLGFHYLHCALTRKSAEKVECIGREGVGAAGTGDRTEDTFCFRDNAVVTGAMTADCKS